MSGYQSRVFTFISKRTNQLKDTCTKGLRHLKVAVVWSGQILLYPLHLLAQTAKIFQPQLAPPPPQNALTSQPIPDLNIEQALELVAATEHPIAIAGVPLATEARSIIDENLWNVEHINIDEPIFDRDLNMFDRLAQSDRVTIGKPIIRGMSSLLVDRQLVLVTTTNEIIDILTSSQQQEIRRRIGMDLAISWEYWHQAKLSDRQHSPQLSSIDREFLLPARLEEEMYSSRNKPTLPPSKLFDAPGKWQQLTGWLKKVTSPQTTIDEPQLPRQLPSASYPLSQPPMNRFLDLPQLPPIKQPQTLASQERPVRTSQFSPDLLKQWWNYYRDYFYIPARTTDSIVHQPAEFKLTPLTQPLESRMQLGSKNTQLKETFDRQNLIPLASNSNQQKSGELSRKIDRHIEHHPDWIEADVEDIGYIKSPLTRFLAWLDRITLQIENWLIKIWRIFKKLRIEN